MHILHVFAYVAVICTLVFTDHILFLYDEHRSDSELPTLDLVHIYLSKMQNMHFGAGVGAYIIWQVHMLFSCAWSVLPECCLEVDRRSTVERFALLPALNSVFCLCKA